MSDLRLTKAVTYTDYDRGSVYIGPGTFPDVSMSESQKEEFLKHDAWEPADAFDAEEFLDRPTTEIKADWCHINGTPTADYDDKLDELRQVEHANRQRRSVIDMIEERAKLKEPNSNTFRNTDTNTVQKRS